VTRPEELASTVTLIVNTFLFWLKTYKNAFSASARWKSLQHWALFMTLVRFEGLLRSREIAWKGDERNKIKGEGEKGLAPRETK